MKTPGSKSGYRVIGIMSGTSLDGLDLSLCNFCRNNGQWNFEIIKASTIPYPDEWKKRLRNAFSLSPSELDLLDKEYGRYLGQTVLQFKGSEETDLIASHGHTVFHRPEAGITRQIGDGQEIADICRLRVVFDFRSMDVNLGGQGAPLVPVGDRELFGSFEGCLNLGGFSNISYEKNGSRKAFDICPVNIVLNHFALLSGNEYDRDGMLGRKGKLIPGLNEKLDNLAYYSKKGPASLGMEWVQEEFLPLVSAGNYPVEDILHTIYRHIASRIKDVFKESGIKNCLVTGGGSLNTYLMELLKKQSYTEIVIPSEDIINFKEAIIFGFLAVLRVRNDINCLSSVTGAKRDSSGGRIANYK